MPTKQTLMPSITCPTGGYLESALAIYQVRGHISKNQARAILTACAHNLPASVSLAQRTPKGVVYVNLNDQPHCEITTRARIFNVYDLS